MLTAMWVQGFTIYGQGEDTRRLVECVVRRLTGNEDATPDTTAGILQIMVPVREGTDVPAQAERFRDECAAELGIADPWKLLSVLRPE
jgi:hypothetical protein